MLKRLFSMKVRDNIISDMSHVLLARKAAIVHLIWHLCKASGARKVERVQKRALKIVYNTHSVEYFNLLHCAHLLSLQSRCLQNLATLMHQVKCSLVLSNVVDIFSVQSSKHHLRNMEFHSPTFNSEHYGKHSLRYFGPYIWYRSDNKFKANLPHNPLSKTYSVLTLKIL